MRAKHQDAQSLPTKRKLLSNRQEYDAFQLHVFDSATSFFTLQIKGRVRDRVEFGLNLKVAMQHYLHTPYTCLYCINEAGRGICLDYKDWPMWIARWEAAHGNGLNRQNSN